VDSIDARMQAIPHGQEDTVSDQQLSAMHELANVSRLVSTDTQTSDRMFRQSVSVSSDLMVHPLTRIDKMLRTP
jgi:hypothetical protein